MHGAGYANAGYDGLHACNVCLVLYVWRLEFVYAYARRMLMYRFMSAGGLCNDVCRARAGRAGAGMSATVRRRYGLCQGRVGCNVVDGMYDDGVPMGRCTAAGRK